MHACLQNVVIVFYNTTYVQCPTIANGTTTTLCSCNCRVEFTVESLHPFLQLRIAYTAVHLSSQKHSVCLQAELCCTSHVLHTYTKIDVTQAPIRLYYNNLEKGKTKDEQRENWGRERVTWHVLSRRHKRFPHHNHSMVTSYV